MNLDIKEYLNEMIGKCITRPFNKNPIIYVQDFNYAITLKKYEKYL